MHCACDLVMGLGDFNGQFDRYFYGFDGDHGGYGVGQMNLEGRIQVEWSLSIVVPMF